MGDEGRAKVGQMGLPEFEPGVIVRVPLADLHEFLEANGLRIVGRLSGPDAKRLVVELAPASSDRTGSDAADEFSE